jgi:hypothetical protein
MIRQSASNPPQPPSRVTAPASDGAALRGPAPWAWPAQTTYGSVSLRYLENSPVRVQGPVTGRQYDFSASHPVQAVDPRDAAPLLRTRFFQQTR